MPPAELILVFDPVIPESTPGGFLILSNRAVTDESANGAACLVLAGKSTRGNPQEWD